MNSLFEFPNIIWLGLALVVMLGIVHLVALKLVGRYFKKKYPEAFAAAEKEKITKQNKDINS